MELWEIINSGINDAVASIGESAQLVVDGTTYDIKAVVTGLNSIIDQQGSVRAQNKDISMRFVIPDELDEVNYGDKIIYRNNTWNIREIATGVYRNIQVVCSRDRVVAGGQPFRSRDV